MTLLRLAVASHRTGIIAMLAMGVLAGVLNAAAFVQVAGTTPEERLAFGRQMSILGRQMTYLLPEPVQLETMGGYLTWRAFSAIALILGLWAVLAATGAGRGDEERGLTEHWLAAGVSRVRWLATRALGFVVAASVVIGLSTAATGATAAATGDGLPAVALAEEAVALLGLVLAAFGIGLVIAQLVVTRRAAGSIGAIALVALYLLNSAARSGVEVGGLRDVSPYALFERSAPLREGGVLDLGATAVLYATALGLVLLSVAAFAKRDVGGVVLRAGRGTTGRPSARPARDPFLRLPVLAMVDQQRGWLAGWTLGLAALAYFLTSIGKSIVDGLMAVPTMRVFFERLGVAAYTDFVGVLWFGTGLFILSALTVAQVNGWAADDGEGRLEAALASGASRSRIVLERIAALLVIVAVVAAASSAVVYVVGRRLDLLLPEDRMVLATALVLPMVFAFAGLGAALVGWRPRLAVVLLGAVAVLSYFLQQFAVVFAWPDWVAHLSIYELYGSPLSRDDWGGIAALVAIGVAGTALALLSMRRRDVGT